MQMQSWTIEMDVPFIELEPPTERAPRAEVGFMSEMLSASVLSSAADWFTERDEAPTKIDGKVRVFGEPMKLKKRGRAKEKDISSKHPDGPGPSLESVISNFVKD